MFRSKIQIPSLQIRFFFVALYLLLSPLSLSAQQLGLDYDNDGYDDLSFVSIQTDGSLLWSAFNAATTASTITPFSYGKAGDHLAPASWDRTSTRKPLIIRKGSTDVKWVLRGARSLTFGKQTSTFIGGADVDGNGITDPVTVDTVGTKLLWKVVPNYFKTKRANQRSYTFGSATELPFYFRSNNSGDLLATASSANGATVIKSYDIATRKTASITVPGVVATEAPLPLRQAAGDDILALITKSSETTTLTFTNSVGLILSSTTISGAGIIVVGNYLEDSGEEIALQSDSTITIINPSTAKNETKTLSTAIPVDHVNINTFSSTPSAPAGPCKNEILNPRDGNEGFLWKPLSDKNSLGRGNLAIHIPSRFAGIVDGVDLYTPEGSYIESGTFGGLGNPNRPLFRFSKRGPTYAQNTRVVIRVTGGCTSTYVIATPDKRID
jgi:hypothetical protein